MNVDQEFFRIVEELGPLGTFEIDLSQSRTDGESGGCGCQTEEGEACCSNPAENAWSKVTFAGSPGGPADKRITPFPKWDPASRAWWIWDESKGSWLKAA